jgi:CubicO group peptidase (beta-lactamase class C family)
MRLTVSCVAFLCVAATAIADPVDDYVRAQLGVRHLPGVSVAVIKDGRIVKAAGYGLASLELDAPASEHTVYEIGSISKQFAADAVLLLSEDGKLSLDDPLSKYLQRTPPAWSAMTVRHVLTHTAGLPDFDTGNIGFSYRREYTETEFVDLLAARPLDFAPGERWNHTNGFPLVGIVVERASGVPYVDFVRTRIFERLGLASARFKSNTDVVPNRADGYLFKDRAYRRGEPLRPAPMADMYVPGVDLRSPQRSRAPCHSSRSAEKRWRTRTSIRTPPWRAWSGIAPGHRPGFATSRFALTRRDEYLAC